MKLQYLKKIKIFSNPCADAGVFVLCRYKKGVGKMQQIKYLIEYYGAILIGENKLSYTHLMFELMNELSDADLKELRVDIVEIADKVMDYVEHNFKINS